MDEDISDLIKKYSKKDPEQEKRARAELERTNSESEHNFKILALEIMEKKQYLEFRKQWNFHIKWAFWLNFVLIAVITVISLWYHWKLTLNLVVGLTTLTQAIVLVLANFIFPRSQIQ